MDMKFETIKDLFQNTMNAKTVFGEPVAVEGKTIIPVARTGFGFGGGMRPGVSGTEVQEGQGGGGGAAARPVGVLEVTSGQTRYIAIGTGKKLLAAAAIGWLLGSMLGRRHAA